MYIGVVHCQQTVPDLFFHAYMNLVFDPGFLASVVTMTNAHFVRKVFVNMKLLPRIRQMFCLFSSFLPVTMQVFAVVMMSMPVGWDCHSLG